MMTKDINTNAFGQQVGAPLPDWQPRARPNRDAMIGKFCRLEAVDATVHGDDLFDAFGRDTDGRNWTYLGYGPFPDRVEFDSWLAQNCLGNDPLFHAIIDQISGRAVGLASFLRIDPEMGVIEVGHIHYSPLLQQKPAATEAMFLMMRRVFDELGYRRYEWKCDALNAPSRNAANRLGFRYEGLFRQALVYKGRNRDTAWYSIIDQEWPALKQAFQSWLDDGNFDTDDRQKSRLQDLR